MRGIIAALLLLAAPSAVAQTPPPVSGRSLSQPGTITPSDVLARTKFLQEHLEQIRLAMGRPPPPEPLIRVDHAEPREVLFMAYNVRRRVAQLAYEHLRTHPDWREPLPPQIRAFEVYDFVDKSLIEVLNIQRHLGIETAVVEHAQDESVTPSQVFEALLRVGALVDVLTKKESDSTALFEPATYCVHIAQQVHLRLVQGRMPETPSFEPNKTPGDVFDRLVQVYERTRRLAEKAGRATLDLEVVEQERWVTTDEASDLLALVVAELLWLHGRVQGAEDPVAGYPVEGKLPSHLYQRLGLLQAILDDIDARGRFEGRLRP